MAKKSFKSDSKSSVAIELPQEMAYHAVSEFVGSYEPGQITVHGFIKTKSNLYNKDQFVLVVKMDDSVIISGVEENIFFMNIPAWWGKKLEDDFRESGKSSTEYFTGVSITSVEAEKSKYNNTTYNIELDVPDED